MSAVKPGSRASAALTAAPVAAGAAGSAYTSSFPSHPGNTATHLQEAFQQVRQVKVRVLIVKVLVAQ